MDLDVVVLGTGLSESIVAAALSKAGFKVAHVDANPYYGDNDASLTLDELLRWAEQLSGPTENEATHLIEQRKRFSGFSYYGTLPPQSRQYAVSLQPTIIPSTGPLIDALIESGVSRYGGFKLLERVAVYDGPGTVQAVPGSKEDVFKNKDLSLLQKRRLMRFLMFAGGDFEGKAELHGNEQASFASFLRDKFSLDEKAVQVIVYALAFCMSETDPALPALERVRRYLRSTGRYGPSPFLVGHYGGLGEISQGFCRTSAVGGATYVLGRHVVSIKPTPAQSVASRKFALQLEDLSEELLCDALVISSDPSHHDSPTPSILDYDTHTLLRCIAIIDTPILFSASTAVHNDVPLGESDSTESESDTAQSNTPHEIDTAVIVFPPSSLPAGSPTLSVNVLITGEGSMSAPRGKWIVHMYMPVPNGQTLEKTPEQILRPYLDATLSLSREPVEPLFTLFYMQRPHDGVDARLDSQASVFRAGPRSLYLPEIADSAVTNAEATFWRIVRVLQAAGSKSSPGEQGERRPREIDSLWPPLEYTEDNDEW